MRVLVFVAICAAFAIAGVFEAANPRHPQRSLSELILIPPLVAGFFLVLFELPNFQRVVRVTDNEITCMGTLMMFGGVFQMFAGMGNWHRASIRQVGLLRLGEPGNPYSFGLMAIIPKSGRTALVGVPNSMPLENVASELTSLGIDVLLSDWTSSSEPTPTVEQFFRQFGGPKA